MCILISGIKADTIVTWRLVVDDGFNGMLRISADTAEVSVVVCCCLIHYGGDMAFCKASQWCARNEFAE